jgi:alanine dehydrogenase
MHVTNVSSSEIQPTLPHVVNVAVRAGEATPRLEKLPQEASHARGGFLGYIAGQPEERALVPRLEHPPQVINMSRLVDLISGNAPGRTDDQQTTFFLNGGAIGPQFGGVAAAVYNRAREQGVGTEIPTDWFLQDIRD